MSETDDQIQPLLEQAESDPAPPKSWAARLVELNSTYDRTLAVLTLQTDQLEKYPNSPFTKSNAENIQQMGYTLETLGREIREIEAVLAEREREEEEELDPKMGNVPSARPSHREGELYAVIAERDGESYFRTTHQTTAGARRAVRRRLDGLANTREPVPIPQRVYDLVRNMGAGDELQVPFETGDIVIRIESLLRR